MERHQQTIGRPIEYCGAGLHSGIPVKMVMKPAPENTGVVFVRTDIEGHPSVKATIGNVTKTMRAITLEDGEAKVFTVEHVLSALYAMHIDNCIIEMDSAEPPVGDGSGAVFASLIEDAGIVEQEALAKVHVIKEVHSVYDGDRFVAILPYDGFKITFTSVNQHPLLGTQLADYEITKDTYIQEISRARTIGFMHEIEALQAMGLAKGGNLENCLVYDDTKCLSVPRFEDELVRHKVLDLLGDISLVGPLKGHIIAVKSSHELNSLLSREIMKEM